MAGWGGSSWGSGHWGSSGAGVTAVFTLSRAVVYATNCVRVTTTLPMRQDYATGAHDALNTDTWTIERVSDGFSYIVISAVAIDPYNVDLYVIGSLEDMTVQYRVTENGLYSSTGSTVFGGSSLLFNGIYTPESLTIERPQSSDLRSYATPRNPLGGTLVISGGDYQEISGDEWLKNMILRRLLTRPGEFFYAPDYGFGLTVKGTVNTGALLQLKVAIERQVSKEPEVRSCSAALEYKNNVLTVKIAVVSAQSGATILLQPFSVPV